MLSAPVRARLAALSPEELAGLLLVVVPSVLAQLRGSLVNALGRLVVEELERLPAAELLAELDELHGGDVLGSIAARGGVGVGELEQLFRLVH
jgi:hypothetical protein